MVISFPTIASCVFAAYLFGGTDLEDHSYEPIPNPSSECTFSAWVNEGEFHLERDGHEVFIALPIHRGWYRFQYDWGQDQAYMSVPGETRWYPIPVRMGSDEFY
ncbi:hypothetical protein [Nitrospira sp. M1]